MRSQNECARFKNDNERGVDRMRRFKKFICSLFLVVTIVCISPTLSHAENNFEGNALVTSINFDQSTRVLSGKTAAYANIYLSNTAITAVADANGDYQLPIPSEMATGDILIVDVIDDQKTTITYDFNETAAASSVEESSVSSEISSESSISESSSEVSSTTSSESSTSSTSTSQKSSSKASSSAISSTSDKKTTQENDGPPVFLIVLIVGCIVILGVLVYFSFLKPNKENKK